MAQNPDNLSKEAYTPDRSGVNYRVTPATKVTPSPVEVEPTYEFVNAPKHYNDHPSGVECQQIIRECKDPMISFAMKHLWRSQWGGKPGQTTDQDLAKAIEYIELEQARRAGVPRLEKKAQQ